MVLTALLLFIIVLVISFVIYSFCKKLIYKLNKRVLARNLAIIKNGEYLNNYTSLNRQEKLEKLVIPFFMVMGYNTYDLREFARVNKNASFAPDFITKKWDKSRLCKRPLYIKFADFSEKDIDFQKKEFYCNNNPDCDIDELMNPLYFKGDYLILTNGCFYIFFSKKRLKDSRKFVFIFNLKNYNKNDIAQLANYTKQCMFLDISDVFYD